MAYFPPWGEEPYDRTLCPPMNFENWEWVGGTCTGNAWAFAECVGYDRPIIPPEWYPVGLRHGVYRMRLKWD